MTRPIHPSPSFLWPGAVALVLFLAAATRAPAVINPTEWKHRQTFDVPGAAVGPIKIALPAETLDLARPEFDDLRVLGPSGEEIPCVVAIPRPPPPATRPPHSFQVRLQKTATELTLETGTVAPLESVELLSPAASFIKAARLEFSADGEHWTLAADGLPLARSPGLEAVTLPLNHATPAFLRVTLDDWRAPAVPFTGARLHLAAARPVETIPVDAALVKREEFARETVLTLDLKSRHLPLAALEFTTAEALFSRPVTVTRRGLKDGESTEQVIARGTIYRSPFSSPASPESLRVSLDFTTDARELRIHLVNEDNAPLAISAVSVRRRPVQLLFRAPTPGTFTLLTGHAQVAKPAYDLTRFSREFNDLPEAPLAVSAATPNPRYQTPDTLAPLPLLGPPLDVTDWNFHKPVVVATPGVQELELDREVLAHAQPAFADLRLMRDGAQVPYLLERTASLRSISVHPLAADDPSSPRTSRWRFRLTLAALPVRRVVLTSTTPLFNRRLQIFELGSDARGETVPRALADSLAWRSTPEQPHPSLTIELRATPQTDALYVATDNGDNPPIALGTAHADYAVTRLLFRATPGPLELYYGARTVPAPSYDLELVARQLLQQEKSRATLGAEVSASGTSGKVTLLLGPGLRSGVLLGGALGLVVIVLLVVIARLLPKPPSGLH